MIRPATVDDIPQLSALAAATFPLACPPGSTRADQDEFVSHHLGEDSFARYLADPGRALFVAVSDTGALAGYTMLVFGEPTDPNVRAALAAASVGVDSRTAELSKCYAHPDHHGTGLAAELLTATLAHADAAGMTRTWLGVNQLNVRAQRFYAKHGFTSVGTKRFVVGSRTEDDYVLLRESASRGIHSAE